jgi:DNA (cytosine-5)-methyltransferase 1
MQSELGGGCDGGGKGALVQKEKSGTLGTGNDQTVFCIQGNCIDRADTAGCNGKGWREGQSYTLNTIDRPAVCVFNEETITSKTNASNPQYGDPCHTLGATGAGRTIAVAQGSVALKSVRRLTPLECERLQGFPDGWTDIGEWIDSKGKKHECSDSARYKALGNSIALPFWIFLCKRISAQYARKATMASLFDGIGGFPLAWEKWNGKGSAVWASEKDDFLIAVTKYHFKE